MISKIGLKLTASYILVIVVATLILGLLFAGTARRFLFEEKQRELVHKGEQLGQTVIDFFNGEMPASTVEKILEVTGQHLEAKIMVLDPMGRRLAVTPGLGRRGAQLSRADFARVISGETIVRRGYDAILELDAIFVGTPVHTKHGQITGAVFLIAPLTVMGGLISGLWRLGAFAALIGVAFALLLALYLSRTISAPILKLKAAAAAMAQGNFKVRVPSGSDEIGALATAFNLMAAELGKVEKLRKQLSADLAHELRAPLTIIQGQTEALLDGVIEEEAEKEKFLRDILGETVRLSEMVRALLEIAHLDRGAKALNKQVFSLKTLIVSLAEKYQAIAKEKNINLTTILPPTDDLLLVEADEARIGQVVRNFLDNALRYTPPGKEVLIRLQAQDTSVQIEITDHGPGIPAAEQPLIWERFYKVNKARTAGEGGVGLGLAIAKEIIQASGGQIWVKSAEGKGATFGFSLPRTSPPAPLT